MVWHRVAHIAENRKTRVPVPFPFIYRKGASIYVVQSCVLQKQLEGSTER